MGRRGILGIPVGEEVLAVPVDGRNPFGRITIKRLDKLMVGVKKI